MFFQVKSDEYSFMDVSKVDQYNRRIYYQSPDSYLFLAGFQIDKLQLTHTRRVYNLMDFIGDLGGVIEIFVILYGGILYRISEHSFNMYATKTLFLAETSDETLFQKPKLLKKDNTLKKYIAKKYDPPETLECTKHLHHRQIILSPFNKFKSFFNC